MATNPAEILAAGQALVPNAGEQMMREQMGRLQMQGAQLQLQAQQQQLRQAQTQMQRQQSFGHDMATFVSNPSAAGLATLFGQYPEYHEQAKQAWDTLDENQRKTDLTQIGSAASLAAKGDHKGAAALIQRRLDADKAAGRDTTEDQAVLDHLNSDDPAQQRAGLGMLTYALGIAAGPEHAGEFLKANGLSSEPFTLNQGDTRYDGQGNVIASSAPKPDYLIIPEGGKAVPVGPSGPQAAGTIQGNPSPTAPAPSGAPAPGTPHRVQGWTPRARDGGDNPDHVVDAKVARLASVVGVDPDAPLTPAQIGALATALPATEGGPGSLAARNNNPGNIKDGAFARRQPGYAGPGQGGYARFETPQAGQQATESLLHRFYGRGQTSIRDIIEGKPVGGTVRGAAPATGAQPGDPAGTLYGNPKPGYHLLTPEEAQTQGLDTAKRWQRGPDGQTTAIGDASVAAPGDPSKTGPEYLATVPGGMASQIKALAEGRLPLPSSFALSKPYWQRLLQATSQYDPSFDAATAKARQQAVQQFTGNGKAAQLVASVNRVANHLQTLYDASEKLVGPDTGFGPLNSALAYGGQRFQPQSLKAFNSALPLVAGELEKIARGSTGTLHGVEQIMNNLSPNESLSTRRQAIKTAIELIHGAIEPLQNQYNSAFTGSSARPAIPWVTPRSQAIYDRLAGEDFTLGGDTAAPRGGAATHAGPPPGAKLIGKRADDGRPVYLLPNGQKVSPR